MSIFISIIIRINIHIITNTHIMIRSNNMKIISFSAIKGGVGKTTLAYNYGEWLAIFFPSCVLSTIKSLSKSAKADMIVNISLPVGVSSIIPIFNT